jgi:hypothetical protein
MPFCLTECPFLCLSVVCISNLSVLYVHLSVCVFVCRFSVCLISDSLSACLSTYLSIFFLSVCLPFCLLSVCLSIWFSVCLCLSNYLSVSCFYLPCSKSVCFVQTIHYMYCMLRFRVGIQSVSSTF